MANVTSNTGTPTRASRSAQRRNIAVGVLGAGAPHAGLMAGALAYMYRHNKTFDIFFTSGGGALIALLFVAPRKGKRADDALREVAEFGIDERIYRLFPVGYKTFFKQSWFTREFHEFAERLKLPVAPRPFPGQKPPPGYDPAKQDRRRLYNDVVDFWASALTPPRIGPTTLGLCAHLPFLEEMVDFDAVNRPVPPSGLDLEIKIPIIIGPLPNGQVVVYDLHPGWFYVNAYNLDAKRIEQFSNTIPNRTTDAGSLTPDAIRGALSFPFVYPPEMVNGHPYCEGALIDPLNLPGVTRVVTDRASEKIVDVDDAQEMRLYLFDILGSLERKLMYCPRSLWDAYGLSILTPVISLAKMSKRIYRLKNPKGPQLVPVKFRIPEQSRDRPLDWSYSNTTALWDAGWRAGKRFLDEYGDELPDRVRP
jgi:hypothetical protein